MENQLLPRKKYVSNQSQLNCGDNEVSCILLGPLSTVTMGTHFATQNESDSPICQSEFNYGDTQNVQVPAQLAKPGKS